MQVSERSEPVWVRVGFRVRVRVRVGSEGSETCNSWVAQNGSVTWWEGAVEPGLRDVHAQHQGQEDGPGKDEGNGEVNK